LIKIEKLSKDVSNSENKYNLRNLDNRKL